MKTTMTERLEQARELVRQALETYPLQSQLDDVTVELIRATASIDRARRALAGKERKAA